MSAKFHSKLLWLVAVTLCALAACAPEAKLTPGQSTAADVTTAWGKPVDKITNAAGETVWFYPRYDQTMYAVRMRPDGTVVAIEQRLTKEYWSQIVAGRTTNKQVRELLGPPGRVLQPRKSDREEWQYRVLADNRDHTLVLSVGPDGVVQTMSLLPVPTM